MDDGTICQKLACTAAVSQETPVHECHGVRCCLDEAFPEQSTASWLPHVRQKCICIGRAAERDVGNLKLSYKRRLEQISLFRLTKSGRAYDCFLAKHWKETQRKGKCSLSNGILLAQEDMAVNQPHKNLDDYFYPSAK